MGTSAPLGPAQPMTGLPSFQCELYIWRGRRQQALFEAKSVTALQSELRRGTPMWAAIQDRGWVC